MANSEVSAGSIWGPGFIGMTVGLALYGVTVCQYLYYISTFPNDKRLLKHAVLLVFVLDTLGTITLISFFCRELIFCRWQTSYACTVEMPWDLSVTLATTSLTAFFVQCFYAHRVWIIGERNKLLTGAVLIAALVQLVFGFALLEATRHTGSMATLFNSPYAPVNAMGSAICDTIITASVFLYLRRSQFRILRKENYIHKLNLVFVQMGLITCSTALATAVLYYSDQLTGQYLTVAPAFILSKAYSNSMLAVLNARKLVCCDHQRHASLELPTLSSIH
ncbi:hypothetical protein BKA82DRAFT_4146699 [Pisolithus tinctorius]|nr:hypothetical protein BKA82DRAFT_4146699 [Pisolithus tinctorius]